MTGTMDTAIETFYDHIIGDVLGHISGITSKRMFGGYGIYRDGVIFAIITGDGELRFKADDTTKDKYEARGGEQFTYTGHTSRPPTPMPYWRVPDEVLEDRELITSWVEEAVMISKLRKR